MARRRWVRVAAIVISLLIVMAASGWVWLKSRSGLEWQRKQLLQKARAVVPGRDLARRERQGGGEIVLRNVVVRDREKREAVSIAEVRLRVDLTGLLAERIDAERIVLVSPRIRAARGRSGAWNLSELAVPAAPRAGAAPWPLDVSTLAIHGGSIEVLQDDGSKVSIDHLELDASLHAHQPAWNLELRSAAATVSSNQRALQVSAQGHAASNGERVEVRADLQAPGGALTIEGTLGAESDLTAAASRLDLRALGFDI